MASSRGTLVSVLGAMIVVTWPVAASAAEAVSAYNKGLDLYGKGDTAAAAASFQEAVNTENRKLEQWSFYNLGNMFFEQSAGMASQNPAQAQEQLKKALMFFRRALELDPEDQDAKYNYELTKKKIRELEQQKQQQEEQQNREQQQQDKQEEQGSQGEQQEQPEQDGQQEDQKQEEQQQKQNQPEQGEKAPQQQPSSEQGSSEEKGTAADGAQAQEMTPQEAMMLLDNFQRGEEMQRKLLQERESKDSPVEKDW